jgi:hypothetical protein
MDVCVNSSIRRNAVTIKLALPILFFGLYPVVSFASLSECGFNFLYTAITAALALGQDGDVKGMISQIEAIKSKMRAVSTPQTRVVTSAKVISIGDFGYANTYPYLKITLSAEVYNRGGFLTVFDSGKPHRLTLQTDRWLAFDTPTVSLELTFVPLDTSGSPSRLVSAGAWAERLVGKEVGVELEVAPSEFHGTIIDVAFKRNEDMGGNSYVVMLKTDAAALPSGIGRLRVGWKPHFDFANFTVTTSPEDSTTLLINWKADSGFSPEAAKNELLGKTFYLKADGVPFTPLMDISPSHFGFR